MTKLVFAAWGNLRLKGTIQTFYDRVIAEGLNVTSILATRAEESEFGWVIKYADMLPPHTVDLWVDSGAYSAWTKGIELTADGYCRFLDQLLPRLRRFRRVHVVSLDKIPGRYGQKPTPDDLRHATEAGIRNTQTLILAGFPVVPVYHQGEPIEVMQQYLSMGITYLGLSPANDSPQAKRVQFLKNCFRAVPRSGNQFFPCHNFGNISTQQLMQFPFYSADSTSWKLSVGFGGMHSKSVVKAGKKSDRGVVNSYRAKHLAAGIYTESVKNQLTFEKEVQAIWNSRGVTWSDPGGFQPR